MKKVFLILLSLVFISDIEINAQMDLKSAVEHAKKVNNGIAAGQKKLESKQSELKSATYRYLPDLSVDFFYTHLGEDLILNLDPIRTVMIEVQSNNQVGFSNIESLMKSGKALTAEQQTAVKSAAKTQLEEKLPHFKETVKDQNFPQMLVNLTQPIYTGGKITAGINAAENLFEIEKIKLEKENSELTQSVINSYLSVILAKENVKVRQSVLSAVNSHAYLAEKLMEAGLIQKHQKLRADVAKSEAERNLFEAQEKFTLSKIALASVLNISIESIDLADSLQYKFQSEKLQEIVKLSEQNNENIRQMQYATKALDAKVDAEFADFLPTVFGYGFYNVFDNYIAEIEPKWGVGIGAHLNIFDGFRKNSKHSEAKLEREAMQLSCNEVQRKIALLANSQYVQMQIAENSFKRLEKSVEQATENLRLNEKRFETGLGTTLDVIDAQLALESINLNKIKALFDYYSNMSQLYATAGKLDRFIDFWQKK